MRRDGAAAGAANRRRGLAGPWPVDIRPSRRLAVVLAGGHLMAAGAASAAGLPWPAALALMLVICASGWLHLARLALLTRPESIVRMQVDGHGGVEVHYRDGRTGCASLVDSTVVGWHLTLVRLRIRGDLFVRTVPLLGDNCCAVSFRRLRTGLAWQAGVALRS